jgi:hypothetical protein
VCVCVCVCLRVCVCVCVCATSVVYDIMAGQRDQSEGNQYVFIQ